MGFFARIRRRLRPPRRLRFHREGRYFVFITVGIGIAAINTGNNLLYLILGWMLSVIVASGVLSEQCLRKLKITRRPPGEVFAGRPFLMSVTVANEKRRLPTFSLEVEDLVGTAPVDKRCYFLKIPARKHQTTAYRHTFSRRGRYVIDGARLSTRYPFGLFRKSRDVAAPSEILVYPALVPVEIPARGAALGGEEARARRGRRGEFHGLREFRHGDDTRDVHWRSSARAGRLMVREYEEESHRRASILLDNALPAKVTSADEEALERVVSLAASLAVAYLERGYSVTVIARGAQVPAGLGPSQRVRVLRALALLEGASPETPFAARPEPGVEATLITRRGMPAPRAAGMAVLEAGA